ncbi:J73 / DnaJ domain-containing protein / JDP73 [Leishmania donovani]|uniref:DnaJ_domain_containing_protein_-_putative n=3 Tax=Leishmania donovani species complex TaxID=38574 RepID=A0A6L0XS21_LEIIN|nr:conserved hypothetical protein [Leishmania infantum JPCM5]CAC9497846.1 DnaJ_domain_containing_protein_-_putative [Leishmania infantum]CAJ1989845.1 J73 / DnaJ domain-containing protein / JDP73 [Leishmania donovani]CAM68982.1 conserved hypothetical protein [Leishmania infantum JPCM5]SUZ42850.1 DnaJ_domain_containing_protein_-_putative [Leishmania infantum]VDZ45708.1 DnaJ_domain_containing_protein_putative/Pfam:PF00226 [Leishmania donovani]|eukprot:XP_001470600.1 conserved hypothetical protein [Leishmania infantum JPCM5]
MEAVQIAKSILAADGQPFVILSLAQGFAPVTPETPLPVARRSYMRLAGVIHPDRLKGSFDKATEAFQCLVSAFECFADPKARKQAAAAAQGKSKAESRASTAADGRKAKAAPPSSTTSRPSASQQMKKANSKAAAAPAVKKPKASAEGEEESESESDTEDDDASEASVADEKAWEALAAANTEPEVSTNRTPIGQPRLGGLYQHTTVGCPKCRSLWEPDSRPQYSLFMGQWGKKVHCQLCLFQFGCATALHGCPHCSAPFDYDASMYDTVQTCQRCKRQFGFPYYPVSQHLIDQIALEEWRERMERQKTSEREARARARHGGGGRDEATATEKMQLLVGTCIMEEECPLCHKRVKSKHRAHVEECMATPPGELATSAGRASRKTTRAAPPADKVAKAPASRTAKTTPKANPKTTTPGATKKSAVPRAPRAKASPPATAKGKKTSALQKRKRQRSDSDFSEGEDSLSDSEEDAISSESSFSYSDYDDSD